MQLPSILILVGAFFGVISIGLGITALATPNWIQNNSTYSLLRCERPYVCLERSSESNITKGLEIAGIGAIAVGLVFSVVLDILTKNRWIHLLPQILLTVGSSLILIGLILYVEYVASDDFKPSNQQQISLSLGYSLILMIIACVLGFCTAVYLAYIAGLGRYDNVDHYFDEKTTAISMQISERF